MLVPSTGSAFPILASVERISPQRTIAVEAFAAAKVESVVVIEADENVVFDWSVVERGTCASRHLWPWCTGALGQLSARSNTPSLEFRRQWPKGLPYFFPDFLRKRAFVDVCKVTDGRI